MSYIISQEKRMFSRIKRALNGVFGRGGYTHNGREFTLAADTCDDLRKTVETARALRQSYAKKCTKGQRRIGGFYRDVQNANLMVLREFERICTECGFVRMLYDGALSEDQSRHVAVLAIDVGERDLQQCRQ